MEFERVKEDLVRVTAARQRVEVIEKVVEKPFTVEKPVMVENRQDVVMLKETMELKQCYE